MRHFLNVFLHASIATFIVLFAGAGLVAFRGPIAAGVLLAAVTTLVTLAGGVFALIAVRMTFKLKAAGLLAEIACFWLIGSCLLAVLGRLAPAWLTVNSALVASFAVIAGVVVLAYLTGNIRSFGRRSWLPQR